MNRASITRAVARLLVASQLLTGLPAFAARPDGVPQDPQSTLPPPNRTVPAVAPPTVVLSLPESPTDAELMRARIFSEPLVPMPRGTTAAENRALAKAISEYAGVQRSEMVAPLLAFLAQYPQSAWRPSLLANLGTVYRSHGYLGRALSVWEQAWDQAKGETDLRARDVADFALGAFLELNSKVGRADAIATRLDEIVGRNLVGRAAVQIAQAREALAVFRFHHELAAASGPVALQSILAATGSGSQTSEANALLQDYHAMPAGTSLSELKTLATRVGLSYEMAARAADADFPVPSVIHWRIDHYSAIVKKDGSRYLVLDPILGGAKWIARETLDEETSATCSRPSPCSPPAGGR